MPQGVVWSWPSALDPSKTWPHSPASGPHPAFGRAPFRNGPLQVVFRHLLVQVVLVLPEGHLALPRGFHAVAQHPHQKTLRRLWWYLQSLLLFVHLCIYIVMSIKHPMMLIMMSMLMKSFQYMSIYSQSSIVHIFPYNIPMSVA